MRDAGKTSIRTDFNLITLESICDKQESRTKNGAFVSCCVVPWFEVTGAKFKFENLNQKS